MTVSDLQADSFVHPMCFKVRIKFSKTNPLRVGCDIYLGQGVGSVCPITAFCSNLSPHGSAAGPLFIFTDGRPLTRQQLSSSVQSILNKAGYFGSYSGHSIAAATTAAAREFQITLSRPSGVGLAVRTISISALQLVPLSVFQLVA